MGCEMARPLFLSSRFSFVIDLEARADDSIVSDPLRGDRVGLSINDGFLELVFHLWHSSSDV